MKSYQLHFLFKAFSDLNRLRILHLLTRGERCVCEMMEVLKMGQSKVSRHLSYLRRMKLVTGRKSGQWVYYSLVRPGNAVEGALFGCLGSCFGDVPVLHRDMEILETILKRQQVSTGKSR